MPDRLPARNPLAAWRVYDGQAVILCPDDGTLSTLNPVGTLIWEAADGQTPLESIVARICDAFDVAPERAAADARAFVDRLRDRGLLAPSERPGG